MRCKHYLSCAFLAAAKGRNCLQYVTLCVLNRKRLIIQQGFHILHKGLMVAVRCLSFILAAVEFILQILREILIVAAELLCRCQRQFRLLQGGFKALVLPLQT